MSWQNINKIKFYCFYFENIDTPVTIEAQTKAQARHKFRSIRHTLPDQYITSRIVGESVKCPVFGVTSKKINGVNHVWVGTEHSPTGWMDEKKFNE
jgi:hypothetical protein